MNTEETTVETKKATTQLSLRIPSEIKERLVKGAAAKGIPLTDFVIPILAGENQTETGAMADISMKVLADKADVIIEMLGKQIDKASSGATDEQAVSELEKQIDDATEEARREHEEYLRSEYFMILLNEDQKNFVLDLLAYRKQKRKPFSDNLQSLFYFMLKETFSGFNTKHPKFDEDFQQVFAKEFEAEPATSGQPGETPAAVLITLKVSNPTKLVKVMERRNLSELEAVSHCVKYTLKNSWDSFPQTSNSPVVQISISNSGELGQVMDKMVITEQEAIDYCIEYTFKNDWL